MASIKKRLSVCHKFFVVGTIMFIAVAPSRGGESQQETDAFADGDVLKIMAFGREDLTGQYAVQPGRLLSLPLIGPISLVNRTPRELEEALAKDWENRLGSPMSVTIEFVERAPFFVLGAVRAPGMYPYRSGLTVIQALAISGGFEKFVSNDPRLRMDALRERERQNQAIARMAQATATRARLLAEREGKKEIQIPESFTLVSKSRMEELIAEQQQLLNARLEQDVLKHALLTNQVEFGEAEIASYQQQYDTVQEQLTVVAKELTRAKRLPGHVTRVFELEQRTSSLETTAIVAQGNIARAKANVAAARNGIAALREARLQDISETLIKAEELYSESEVTERSAAQVLERLGFDEADVYPEFRLTRRGSVEYEIVGPSALLSPGDVLELSVPAPQLRSAPDTTAEVIRNSN